MVQRLLTTLAVSSLAVVWGTDFSGLEWRLIGPFRGGRTVAGAGVPGDYRTFYFGSVGGGIWKTSDAGNTWKPIFEGQPVSSIGALAIAPSDPNVIYAGTGESDWRSDLSAGAGVYKSVDAGKTWQFAGLKDSRHIGRIVIDPRDPEVVYVASMGHAYGPNEERGVFVTRDGGATWNRTLFKGPELCAVDLAMPADDPNTLYATLWRARRSPWSQYPPVEGPGGGLFKSSDAGRTWAQVSQGLPSTQWGRSGVSVTADGKRVYVLVDTKDGGMFRSDDGGASFEQVSKDSRIYSRGWYFGRVSIDPQNPDVVYTPNVALYKSSDGGRNFNVVRGAPGGDDYHFLWLDPTDSKRMICSSDQGATVSLNGGATWTGWYNQPTGQLYHVTVDNAKPYYSVYGSQQDSGTAAIPSRTNRPYITDADRTAVGGGESGSIAIDPRDPSIVYVNDTNGTLSRMDRRTGQSQIITPWPRSGFNMQISERKYRHPWTSPLIFSPTDPTALYYGAQFLLKTVDGGLTWKEISPDLTGDKGTRVKEPPTVETSKEHGYGTIYSIAPSRLRSGLIWVGSDTGLIHVTRDEGKTWSNVTPPEIGVWSKITHIEASSFDQAVAYAAVDRHRLDDYQPHLYRTRDGGKTWTRITAGIAGTHFVNAVREDPKRRGLMYAATEFGVYVSFNDGDQWESLQLNLPMTSVRDLVIADRDLVVATHGRSFWILDDVSPLRQYEGGARATRLMKPEPALRAFFDDFQGTPIPPDVPQARVPSPGAVIDYWLEGSSNSPVTLEILDPQGQVIRKYSTQEPAPEAGAGRRRRSAIADIWIVPPPKLSAHTGHNRFTWDLRYAPVTAETSGPRVLPGTYQVRLQVDGKTFTQAITVVNDPRSRATPAELAKQFALAQQIYAEMLKAKSNSAAMADLAVALNVAESADRLPPATAYAFLEEARKKLAASR